MHTFVVSVTVEVSSPYHQGVSRMVMHLGLNLKDAMHTLFNGYDAVVRHIRRFTPFTFNIVDVEFEERDRLFLERERATRAYADYIEGQLDDDEDFVLTCEGCGRTNCDGNCIP